MLTTLKNVMPVHIRWLIRRDFPEVLMAEFLGAKNTPMTEQQLIEMLRTRSIIGMVFEHNEEIVGHMIYELREKTIFIKRFIVHPDYRNKRIGAQAIKKLYDKLHKRKRIKIVVDENHLELQLFLRSQGFLATKCKGTQILFVLTK